MTGWNEWEKHVLAELERMNRMHESQIKKIERLGVEMAQIKIKASLWGLLSGSVPAIVIIALKLLR